MYKLRLSVIKLIHTCLFLAVTNGKLFFGQLFGILMYIFNFHGRMVKDNARNIYYVQRSLPTGIVALPSGDCCAVTRQYSRTVAEFLVCGTVQLKQPDLRCLQMT